MTVDELAKLTGHTPLTIRAGLQQGLFPFGVAYKTDENNKRYKYIIYDKKAREYFDLPEPPKEEASDESH